jgi:hypothetical protein
VLKGEYIVSARKRVKRRECCEVREGGDTPECRSAEVLPGERWEKGAVRCHELILVGENNLYKGGEDERSTYISFLRVAEGKRVHKFV